MERMKPNRRRAYTLRKKYGLSVAQYMRLLASTDGRCPMCKKVWSTARLPSVDHSHKTGLVRGLLCSDCNYALGERHDNADWFGAAARYLLLPPATFIIGTHYVPNSPGRDLP